MLIRALGSLQFNRDFPNLATTMLLRPTSDDFSLRCHQLERLVASLRLDSRVRLLKEAVSRSTLLEYLASSDLVVLPFCFVQADAPISIMESLYMDRPVLSSPLDGIPELVPTDAGVVMKRINQRALREALVEALQKVRSGGFPEGRCREAVTGKGDWLFQAAQFMESITAGS